MRMLLTSLVMMVCWFVPAHAQDDLELARTAYAEGRWEEAEEIASDIETADGQLIAAEAAIAALLTFEDGINRSRVARRALRYAEEAMALAPENSRAHQRLATALGLRARHISLLRVWLARMPHRGRDHIDEALRLTPDDPWVLGLSGAWHMEVVRKCGEGCLEASLDTGLLQYRQAAEQAPDDPGIAYHLALALLAEDGAIHQAEARQWLEQAMAAEPEDVFEQDMIAMAGQMITMLDRDLDDAVQTAVARLDQ